MIDGILPAILPARLFHPSVIQTEQEFWQVWELCEPSNQAGHCVKYLTRRMPPNYRSVPEPRLLSKRHLQPTKGHSAAGRCHYVGVGSPVMERLVPVVRVHGKGDCENTLPEWTIGKRRNGQFLSQRTKSTVFPVSF